MTDPSPTARGRIRGIATDLAVAVRSPLGEGLSAANLEIAELTTGIDQRRVDQQSPEYIAGAAAALSSLLRALSEQTVSGNILALLRKSHRGRLLTAIATHPGLTQTQLAQALKLKESNLSRYLKQLSEAALIEPALPREGRGKAWALSPAGAQTYLDLLSRPFADFLGDEAEVAAGVRGARAVAREYTQSRPAPNGPFSLGYAATGLPFILEDPRRPEIVLVHNDSLHAWLPPGGHFDPDRQEIPSEKVIRKIRDETGVSSDILWKVPQFSHTETAFLLPGASFTLLEDLRKLPGDGDPHTHHLDFNFICRVPNAEIARLGEGTKPVVRVDLGGIGREKRAEAVEERVHDAIARCSPRYRQAAVTQDVVERIVGSLELLEQNRPHHGADPFRSFTPAEPDGESQIATALRGKFRDLDIVISAASGSIG